MRNSDLLELVVSFGIVKYPLSKILNILPDDVDIEDFKKKFKNRNSDVFKAYQKGVDRGDYDIDIRLFEMAKSGDLKAIEMINIRKMLKT